MHKKLKNFRYFYVYKHLNPCAMKSICRVNMIRDFLAALLLLLTVNSAAQTDGAQTKSDFWKRVQFGGSAGLSFGNNYTNIALAPGAIYNFNQYFAAGVGVQGSYIKVRDSYKAYIYGGSFVALFHPINAIQLSAELEQVRVNTEYELADGNTFDDDFWNTALFLGAGYRTNNVTIGVRYNVLHDNEKNIYSDPFMPFVRVYF